MHAGITSSLVSAISFAVKIFLIEQLTMPRRLRLFARHLQETVRHDDKLSLLTSLSLLMIFRLLAPRSILSKLGVVSFFRNKIFNKQYQYLLNSILSHRSLIKETQTAVIYRHCITMHFNTELDVSYASLFLKVIVTMFENYIL